MQQPVGRYTSIGHAKRVAPAFIAPIMAYGVYLVADKLRSLFDQRADAQIKRLKQKLTKMVADLKDSTRYQRTQALIEKYDPEHQEKMNTGRAPRGGGDGKGANMTPEQQRKLAMRPDGTTMNGRGLVTSSSGRKLADRATSAAATAVTGAGAALSSALGQLVSSAAKNLIGDDPTLLSMLQQAQEQAKELERENAELRRMLGYPPRGAVGGGSSNNVLAAAAAGGGGGGGGGGIGATGSADFAFGSPVAHNADQDALIESPRALSPPQSLPRKEKNINSGGVEEKINSAEEREGGDATTPPAGQTTGAVRRSKRRSSPK